MPFTEYVQALEEAVSGIANVHTAGPPASINAADLPVAWVELPSGDVSHVTMTGGDLLTYHAVVVLAYRPVAQDSRENAYAEGLIWMDRVVNVLRAAKLGISKPTADTKLAITTVAGADFWSVRTDVACRGQV